LEEKGGKNGKEEMAVRGKDIAGERAQNERGTCSF
jgi:hypothetical protein